MQHPLLESIARIFTHTLPIIWPIFIIGTIADKTAESTQFVIFGYDIAVGRFDRFGGIMGSWLGFNRCRFNLRNI